jgi:hypothetical protein
MSGAKQYARKIRDAWSFCLCSYAEQSAWAKRLSDVHARDFMLAGERRKFEKLPNEFIVYRGFQVRCREGLSWSLSRDVAEMFANLNEDLPKGKVVKRRVRKSEVFTLIDNDEQEIIILPRTLNRKRNAKSEKINDHFRSTASS